MANELEDITAALTISPQNLDEIRALALEGIFGTGDSDEIKKSIHALSLGSITQITFGDNYLLVKLIGDRNGLYILQDLAQTEYCARTPKRVPLEISSSD